MPIKVIDHNSELYFEAVKLRFDLLRKPLGMNFSEDELASENTSIHIVAYDDDEILGTCILIPDPTNAKNIKLRQMAVKSGLQGKGIGYSILQFAENISREKGFEKLHMNARKSVSDFYAKSGYSIIGDEFLEVTIPHFLMEKEL